MPSRGSLPRGFLFAGALALLAAPAAAADAPEVTGSCSVKFFATSTLHDFEGAAPCALLAIESPDASGRYGARAEVAIARMSTGISARDKKMREMFQAKKYPLIVAAFASLDPAALRARKADALPFKLTMHGVERVVTPTLTSFTEVPGASARFEASFTLSLRDFGMEGPLAMGFMRVGDRVRVVVSAELSAKNASATPAAPTR